MLTFFFRWNALGWLVSFSFFPFFFFFFLLAGLLSPEIYQ